MGAGATVELDRQRSCRGHRHWRRAGRGTCRRHTASGGPQYRIIGGGGPLRFPRWACAPGCMMVWASSQYLRVSACVPVVEMPPVIAAPASFVVAAAASSASVEQTASPARHLYRAPEWLSANHFARAAATGGWRGRSPSPTRLRWRRLAQQDCRRCPVKRLRRPRPAMRKCQHAFEPTSAPA